MKILAKDDTYKWIICSYSVDEYLNLINEHKSEIINELIKHC